MSYAESTPLPSIEFDIARRRQFEKIKKRRSNDRLRSEAFVPAKPELVCAIRIRSITDNLGRSRPFSPSDGMFCILRRCRISFALSEDRPPCRLALVAGATSGSRGKEGKKGGGRHERHKSDPSLEIRSNSRSCITWQKEHPRRDDRC